MNKLIYVMYLPLTKKVRDDYFLNTLGKQGFSVEYWDITPLYFNNESVLEHYETVSSDYFKVIRFNSLSELQVAVKGNSDSLYILMMTFEWMIVPILRILTKYGCSISCFAFQMLPWRRDKSSCFIKIRQKIREGGFFRAIANNILLPLAINCGYIKMFDYMFTGGEDGWKGAGWIKEKYLKNIKMLYLNNFDYDKFINSEDFFDSENNIVFIDQYYPFHPDSLLFSNYRLSADIYYSQLNNLFDILENKYKKAVIVVAHPKALMYKEKNFFCGRKIVYNSTLSAIKHSSFVLAHDSTAIGYAIMCNKPIIFISSSEIMKSYPNNNAQIQYFSNFFHQPLVYADNINMDCLPLKPVLSCESKEVYRALKKKYMTTFDKNVSNEELIKKYIDEIFR